MIDIPEKIEDLAKKANQASLRIANLSTEIKNKALDNVAETLLNNKSEM